VLEAGLDLDGTAADPHGHAEHLCGQVAVGKPPAAERWTPFGLDPHRDVSNERLEPDGPLDRPCERWRGPSVEGDPQVLMKDPAEFDAGLEQ
jgi:hypothetical protein